MSLLWLYQYFHHHEQENLYVWTRGAEEGELFPFFKCYRSAHLAVVGLQHLLYFLIPLVIFVVRLGHHLILLQLLLQLLLPVCCLGLCNKPIQIWANCHFKAKQFQNKMKNWLDTDFLTVLVLWQLYWPFGYTTSWTKSGLFNPFSILSFMAAHGPVLHQCVSPMIYIKRKTGKWLRWWLNNVWLRGRYTDKWFIVSRKHRYCILPSGDGRLSFLSSTSCSISFFRSSWSMAVESKASLTNSDTPGLVDISSSSSRCGWASQGHAV